MKALVFDEYGSYDVLQWKDVPDLKAGPTDVVIQVKATAVNYNDIWGRRGAPQQVPLPHISGSDASGIVVEVGSAVTTVKTGDEVVVHCGRPASGNRDGQEYNIWGYDWPALDGAHAEYVKVPAENVVPKPTNVTFEEAASFPLVLVTAWRKLVNKANIKPGDDVLIWGAAGGLGVMAIQIAKLFHAHAIAVASTDEKLELCKNLGAEYLINRRTQDVRQEMRNILGRRGADIVFEHPGQATIGLSVQLAKWGGIVVTSGATSGYDGTIDLRHIFFRQVSLVGSTLGTVSELRDSLDMVQAGHIKPVIHAVLPMKDGGEGQRMVEEDEAAGKVVLVP
ncbi:MAG: zinc-binding dehydrogenase [Chloroflexi bacterium]|nr:zinc-binding dehydrogenase [Chloroflexota bacterium]